MMGTRMGFEYIDHTADIGVRVTGRTPAELVTEAIRAFYSILLAAGSTDSVGERTARTVDLSAPDGECLLVDLLNELIYRFDAEKLLLPHLLIEELRLGGAGRGSPEGERDGGGARLRGTLRGERFDPSRHALATEVKAATYHGLRIEESKDGLRVDVIFDL
jgi:SHS2 domain-containing protein